MLSTPDGRDVFGYMVECALPDTLYTCENELCTFKGSLGLAQHWLERRLDPKEQRWVTACLLARVNQHEVGETESFSVQEGAFFGNLFADGAGPIDWNACRGGDQASAEFGGLVLRDCTEPDPSGPTQTLCGFNYAGDCASFSTVVAGPYACRRYDDEDGTYGDCHAGEGEGLWPGLKPYREIITTYVTAE